MTDNSNNAEQLIYTRFEGSIELNTPRTTELNSSHLNISLSRSGEYTTFSFYFRPFTATDRHSIDFTLRNTIETGTHQLGSDSFHSAGYLENLRVEDYEYQPYQSKAISGSLNIEVDLSKKGHQTYKVTSFNITVKANNGTEVQTFTGKFTAATGDVLYGPSAVAKTPVINNITGSFNATFPGKNPDDKDTRAPYISQSIANAALNADDFLAIQSGSGRLHLNDKFAGDRREFLLEIKKGTPSGKYKYTPGVDGPIREVRYSELNFSFGRYTLSSLKTVEATLDLEVSADGLYYSSDDFNITVSTTKGTPLEIKAGFKVYLAVE